MCKNFEQKPNEYVNPDVNIDTLINMNKKMSCFPGSRIVEN